MIYCKFQQAHAAMEVCSVVSPKGCDMASHTQGATGFGYCTTWWSAPAGQLTVIP